MQITVRVKPGSRKGPLVESDAGSLTLFVRDRAVDGAANDAVVRLLADHFGIPQRDVTILRGHTSRIKRVEVDA
ncbi:DUF167 family protein [Microbacterium invictum]|uniref:UPF0235 protein BKA10_001355 n=1 Tax=Microbacterium invictum TaxID=515415 RepID=A0AA40VLN6_9MICO|nr:DUF167 domain-containing protein [Microbacterium invictum]MBB4139561.1 hypothetical protein [Microbacterium invictum]